MELEIKVEVAAIQVGRISRDAIRFVLVESENIIYPMAADVLPDQTAAITALNCIKKYSDAETSWVDISKINFYSFFKEDNSHGLTLLYLAKFTSDVTLKNGARWFSIDELKEHKKDMDLNSLKRHIACLSY